MKSFSDFYNSEPRIETEAERAWTQKFDDEQYALAQSRLDKLSKFFVEPINNDEAFKALKEFQQARHEDRYIHASSGNPVISGLLVFESLSLLYEQTDSKYIKQMLDWIRLKEVHEIVDSSQFEAVESESTPEAYEEWFNGIGDNEGLRFQLNEFGLSCRAQSPELKSVYDFALIQINNGNPTLGNEDYYAPDPYNKKGITKAQTGQVEPGEVELAIETLHLFGLTSISDISESAQKQLYHVGVNLDEATYQRIAIIIATIEQANDNRSTDSKQAFAESFLATEFGDDFGPRIITIAECATLEQSEKVFGLIATYRRESQAFAGMYKPFDSQLAVATEKALNERLADIVTAVEYTAKMGTTTVDTAPYRTNEDYQHDGKFDITIASIDDAIETMELLKETFTRRREIVDDSQTRITKVVSNEERMGYQIYRFHNQTKGDVLLHIRKNGAGRYDRPFEYGNRDGVEATCSWVVNPTGDHMLASDKDPQGVSLRFDREGRVQGEAPNSPKRSTIRDDGIISLDISSGIGNVRTPSVRIGRTIAAGNILRAEETGQETSLHHNTNYFDQERYGSARGFEKIVDYVQAMAEVEINSRRNWQLGQKAVAKFAA